MIYLIALKKFLPLLFCRSGETPSLTLHSKGVFNQLKLKINNITTSIYAEVAKRQTHTLHSKRVFNQLKLKNLNKFHFYLCRSGETADAHFTLKKSL